MTYEEVRARLEQRADVPLFAGEVWDPAADAYLRSFEPEQFFAGRKVGNPQAAAGVVSGLLLWNDNFESAHGLAQGIGDATGSYLHGLCHRREGHRGEGLESNLGNTRYWFRRVGEHSAFPAVYQAAVDVLSNAGAGFRWATEARAQLEARGRWDPFAMIDWFAQAEAGTISPQSRAVLEQIQAREIRALVDWCNAQAISD